MGIVAIWGISEGIECVCTLCMLKVNKHENSLQYRIANSLMKGIF